VWRGSAHPFSDGTTFRRLQQDTLESGKDTVAMNKKVAQIRVTDWKKQVADNLSLTADWVMLADEELSFHRCLTLVGDSVRLF
jgi:hypothetical protein